MKKIALAITVLLGLLFVTAAVEARPHRADQSGASRQSAQVRVQRIKKVRKAYRGRYVSRASRSYRSARSYRAYRTARVARPYRAARVRGSDASGSSMFGSLTGGGGLGQRPRQWCGWWMRTQLGGGPAMNLAWNWSRYGSATSPQVGAVVVWRHHVGMITGQASNGQWIVKSGNDGGAVRERARSVSGAVFRI